MVLIRRLQHLANCRNNYEGGTFSSVILRHWVLFRSGVRTLDRASAQQTGVLPTELPRSRQGKCFKQTMFAFKTVRQDDKTTSCLLALASNEFHSTRTDVMVVFPPPWHMREILQLGATRFDLSIKYNNNELRCCRQVFHANYPYAWRKSLCTTSHIT